MSTALAAASLTSDQNDNEETAATPAAAAHVDFPRADTAVVAEVDTSLAVPTTGPLEVSSCFTSS